MRDFSKQINDDFSLTQQYLLASTYNSVKLRDALNESIVTENIDELKRITKELEEMKIYVEKGQKHLNSLVDSLKAVQQGGSKKRASNKKRGSKK
jgi:hypothetical protein